MFRLLVTVVATVVALIFIPASGNGGRYCLVVSHVIDGDTFVANGCKSEREYRIRLKDVWAPEMGTFGGSTAKRLLSNHLWQGKEVTFQWSGEKSYGRFVGNVFGASQSGLFAYRRSSINWEMQRYGYNWQNREMWERVDADALDAEEMESASDGARIGGSCSGSQCNSKAWMATLLDNRINSLRGGSQSSNSSGGDWVTQGPCLRGQSCYSANADADGDGVSCERGCRYWRRN